MNDDLNLEKNSEIDEALKEFEVKSSVEQSEQSSEVFENSEFSGMVRLVMKLSGGAIKEQKQAEYVLLGLVVIIILITLYLFFGDSLKNENLPPVQISPEQSQLL